MPYTITDRIRSLSRLDFSPPHRPPGPVAVMAATGLCIGLSLLADEALVFIGTRIFPATRGYTHFEFTDYAKLTVIGVVIAGLGWPVVARFTADPRWVFCRLAIAVTAVLLLPDLYIWLGGQPGRAVLVLAVMHLAIGLITYNLLVRLAPVRPAAASHLP
jgi:uncharacterized membrane protein YjjP (DUF1212 family)